MQCPWVSRLLEENSEAKREDTTSNLEGLQARDGRERMVMGRMCSLFPRHPVLAAVRGKIRGWMDISGHPSLSPASGDWRKCLFPLVAPQWQPGWWFRCAQEWEERQEKERKNKHSIFKSVWKWKAREPFGAWHRRERAENQHNVKAAGGRKYSFWEKPRGKLLLSFLLRSPCRAVLGLHYLIRQPTYKLSSS